jgi:hypothetical protein
MVIGLALVMAAIPRSARGQDAQPALDVPFTAAQMTELKKWMAADADWEKWNNRWANKIEGHKRRQRPEPPAWLAGECAQLLGGEGLLVRACAHLKEISEDFTTARIRRTIATQRRRHEEPKSRFIERVHIGGGWPLMQTGGFKYGALLESHVSIMNMGRVEVNLPGIMILSLPDGNGGREIKFGTDVSLSFRLGGFRVPGIRQSYLLHLNLANAWTEADGAGFGLASRATLMGLSVTLKKQ